MLTKTTTKMVINFTTLFLFLGCNSNKSISDEVKIGDQIWATRNLDVSHFNNGDSIPEAKSNLEWDKAGEEHKAAYCYYDNLEENGKLFGKLYNWYAVTDSRGIVPNGWRIPNDKDWQTLIDYLGGETTAGPKLKSIKWWHKKTNSTDENGFTALPAGVRMIGDFGSFYGAGALTNWWSATANSSDNAKYSRLDDLDNSNISITDINKRFGMSIRCIKR